MVEFGELLKLIKIQLKMKTNIIINLAVEGIHQWNECPFEDVSFLKNPHRHIFHICCKKEVSHLDRDIEIIRFKRKILTFLKDRYNGFFGPMSCEMIAATLIEKFNLIYCSVLEDGENGAEIICESTKK